MKVLVECFSRRNVKWCWLKWIERKCFWCLLEQSNVKFKDLKWFYFKQLRQKNRKFSLVSVFNEAQHSDCKTLQTVSCFKSRGSFEITSLQNLVFQSACMCRAVVCVCVGARVCTWVCVQPLIRLIPQHSCSGWSHTVWLKKGLSSSLTDRTK